MIRTRFFLYSQYEDWSLSELRTELRSRKLSISGNKLTLISRILSNDNISPLSPEISEKKLANSHSIWSSPFVIFWFFGLFLWRNVVLGVKYILERRLILLILCSISSIFLFLNIIQGAHSAVCIIDDFKNVDENYFLNIVFDNFQ